MSITRKQKSTAVWDVYNRLKNAMGEENVTWHVFEDDEPEDGAMVTMEVIASNGVGVAVSLNVSE